MVASHVFVREDNTNLAFRLKGFGDVGLVVNRPLWGRASIGAGVCGFVGLFSWLVDSFGSGLILEV